MKTKRKQRRFMHTKTASLKVRLRVRWRWWWRTCPSLLDRAGWRGRGRLGPLGVVKIPSACEREDIGSQASELTEIPVGALPVTMFHSSAFISIIIPSDLFPKHQPNSRRVTGSIGLFLIPLLLPLPCKLAPHSECRPHGSCLGPHSVGRVAGGSGRGELQVSSWVPRILGLYGSD